MAWRTGRLVVHDRRDNPTDTPVIGESTAPAIVQANSNGGAETITFDKTVFKTPQTITLNGTQSWSCERHDRAETITGPKAGVTVNGGGNSRVFSGKSWCSCSTRTSPRPSRACNQRRQCRLRLPGWRP